MGKRGTRVAIIGATASLVAGLAILASVILGTYGRAKYVDVTHAPEYAGIVGKEYTFAVPMPACGISMDRNYKPPASEVAIMAPPGFAGPEVLWCDDLPTGTAFRVVGIRRCTNCWGEREDEVQVDVGAAGGYRGVPAWLSGDDLLSNDEAGRPRLSFQYYAPR